VKGTWEKEPTDWPKDVPFVDPNNKSKETGSKPTKDVLIPMLHHLLKKYVSWLLIFQFLLLHTGWAQNWSVFMKFVTPELLPVVHHELNSLIYFGVIVYRSCKHLKTVLFWPTLCFLYVIVNYCLFNSVLHPWYRLYDFRGCRTVAWNSLPSQLRQSVGCGQFRWQLKTFPYGI